MREVGIEIGDEHRHARDLRRCATSLLHNREDACQRGIELRREIAAVHDALRDIWQRHMGAHYPAIALVQVVALVDERASVEIEATAVIT